jgi:hypothetical protein
VPQRPVLTPFPARCGHYQSLIPHGAVSPISRLTLKLDRSFRKESAMARALTIYLAGAAFALTAAAGAAAYAQAGASSDAVHRVAAEADHDAAAAGPLARGPDGRMQRQERRIIIRDGDREAMAFHGRHMDMAEHLRTLLQLKPGQETALQAYVAAVRPAHRERERIGMSRDEAPKTTPERLAEMEKHLADSQAQAHARIDATKTFYAQLEPSQKKVFDEMPMLMMGPPGPMGPMMMHGPMKIRFEHPPMPPLPPVPPVPPTPPPPPSL